MTGEFDPDELFAKSVARAGSQERDSRAAVMSVDDWKARLAEERGEENDDFDPDRLSPKSSPKSNGKRIVKHMPTNVKTLDEWTSDSADRF